MFFKKNIFLKLNLSIATLKMGLINDGKNSFSIQNPFTFFRAFWEGNEICIRDGPATF